MPDEKGQMSVNDAGRKGGAKTKATHGHDFYQKIDLYIQANLLKINWIFI